MSRAVQSHVGSMPIYVAPEVNVSIGPMSVAKTIRKGRGLLSLAQVISVEGPKGLLNLKSQISSRWKRTRILGK